MKFVVGQKEKLTVGRSCAAVSPLGAAISPGTGMCGIAFAIREDGVWGGTAVEWPCSAPSPRRAAEAAGTWARRVAAPVVLAGYDVEGVRGDGRGGEEDDC